MELAASPFSTRQKSRNDAAQISIWDDPAWDDPAWDDPAWDDPAALPSRRTSPAGTPDRFTPLCIELMIQYSRNCLEQIVSAVVALEGIRTFSGQFNQQKSTDLAV